MEIKLKNKLCIAVLMIGFALAGAACGVEGKPVLGLFKDTSAEKEQPAAEDAYAGSGDGQPFTLAPASAGSGLDQLESYRANLTLDFAGTLDGEVSTGHLESLTEIDRSQAAQHRYFNADVDSSNFRSVEGISQFISIEDNIFISRPGETLKFRIEDGAAVSPGDMGFLELEELMILPSAVLEPPRIERLNDKNVLRYSFDQDDLESAEIFFERAEGEAWVTVPGDYLMQYVISATVKTLVPIPNAHLLDEGSLAIQYKLTDINATIPITAPANPDLGQSPFAGFPAPPEAELTAVYPSLIEYTSVISPISATLFYQSGLTATGWAEESSSIFNEKSRLTFSKDDQQLTILVTPAEDPDKIKIVLDLVQQR
jgi:hypothetical protein